MGMGVDATGQHITAAGVDDLGTLRGLDPAGEGGDRLAVDQNIAATGMIVIDDGAAANEYAHDLAFLSVWGPGRPIA